MQLIEFKNNIDDGRLDKYLMVLAGLLEKKESTWIFSEKTRVSPAGQAILCSLLDRAFESGSVPLLEVRGRKRDPFLDHLKNVASKNRNLPNPSVYSFESDTTCLTGNKNNLNLSFMEKIEFKFGMNDDMLFDCRLILQELMQNSIDHSGAERYFMYAGLSEGEIHLGVLDMGVGIPAKLRQKYSAESDSDILLSSLEEGVTTRRERMGGYGLSHFRSFLQRNKGKLTIASGRAQIRFYFHTRNKQLSPLKRFLPGTWCFARIPFSGRDL